MFVNEANHFRGSNCCGFYYLAVDGFYVFFITYWIVRADAVPIFTIVLYAHCLLSDRDSNFLPPIIIKILYIYLYNDIEA